MGLGLVFRNLHPLLRTLAPRIAPLTSMSRILCFRTDCQGCRSSEVKAWLTDHVNQHRRALADGYAIFASYLSDVLLTSNRLGFGKVFDVHGHIMV